MAIDVTVDLNKFLSQFNTNVNTALANAQFILRQATDELLSDVVKRTPVGNPSLWKYPHAPANYTPGQLKASWDLSYKYKDTNSGLFAVLKNPQPYAGVIEYGSHSTQAPNGMLRLALQNYSTYIEESVKRNKI